MKLNNADVLRLNATERLALVLGVLYALVMLNIWIPTFRFVSPAANYLAFAGFQLVPIVLFALSMTRGSIGERFVKFALLLPLAAIAALAGSCSAIGGLEMIEGGRDPSFEQIRALPFAGSSLVVYRTNGGATTAFGIVVRQECPSLPHLMRIRELWRAYPAYEAEIELVSTDRVRMTAPAYGTRRPEPIVSEIDVDPRWCPVTGRGYG